MGVRPTLPAADRARRAGTPSLRLVCDLVEAFIEQAATDKRVLAIKQTLYRTAGPESGIMRSSSARAESGKQWWRWWS